MELDERLAATARPDLAPGDQRVPGDRPTVRGVAGELPLVEDRPGPGDDPGAPLRVTRCVLPAIDGRGGHARAREGHVKEGEALVPFGHESTIAGRLGVPRQTAAFDREVTIRSNAHAREAATSRRSEELRDRIDPVPVQRDPTSIAVRKLQL
jgi:hypothetical protein